LLAGLGAASLWAQPPADQPVGLIERAEKGRIRRAGAELATRAKVGEGLFPGDILEANGGLIRFTFCPGKRIQEIRGATTARFEATRILVQGGSLEAEQSFPACDLPQVDKNISASLVDAGTMTRAVLTGTLEARISQVPAALQSTLRAELLAINTALQGEPGSRTLRVARAEAYNRAGLSDDAAEQYRQLATESPDSPLYGARLLLLQSRPKPPGAAKPPATGGGKRVALLIGVSHFKSPEIARLNFAHEDALLFERFLKSPLGGNVPSSQIRILTNEQGTAANIRAAFEELKKMPLGPQDEIILLFASHGTVDGEGRRAKGYLVTHDTDPQDVKTTGIPMEDLRRLITDDLNRVGMVTALVDVCRSGMVGTIPSGRVNSKAQLAASNDVDGELFLFAASRADEASQEGPQFGGGHGAFSWFLTEGLNGAADRNKDNAITVNELIGYVQSKVSAATNDTQHPTENGEAPGTRGLVAGLNERQGITLASAAAPPSSPAGTRGPAQSATSDPFDEALRAGRLLPTDPNNAFEALARLQPTITRDDYLSRSRLLRAALEDRGQQVLLRYLQGEQSPLTRDEFRAAAAAFSAARTLTDARQFLDSRAAFSLGRSLLFERKYDEALDLLERAIKLDPNRAYAFNGAGIAYLEQGDYQDAQSAFRDAARRAPQWAYPLHNLALTYIQSGEYDLAIQAYHQAMLLTPRFSYLPYNLGLLYQRLNRRRDAIDMYRRAMSLDPASGEPYNALGALELAANRRAPAEQYFRQALDKNPNLLAARHNLAILLNGIPARRAEALPLWRDNLARDSQYLPSRLSLAKALREQGKPIEAVEQYRAALQQKPDYVAARAELAAALIDAGDKPAAAAELREAAHLQPRNVKIYEQLGDTESALGHPAEASAAYAKALENSTGADRRRLRSKASTAQNR
jgi:tetratricopeptide (TPR) repeat protein